MLKLITKYKCSFVCGLLTICLIIVIYILFWYPTTTVILVRHAEKQGAPTNNPSLTQAGIDRAEKLTDVLGAAGVSTIFATQYCRTRQTAQPLAQQLDLSIYVQTDPTLILDPPNCSPEIEVPTNTFSITYDSAQELADRILSEHAGEVIFVAGHSNSVPNIITALGVESPPTIEEFEYHKIFIVTIGPFFPTRLISAVYGD